MTRGILVSRLNPEVAAGQQANNDNHAHHMEAEATDLFLLLLLISSCSSPSTLPSLCPRHGLYSVVPVQWFFFLLSLRQRESAFYLSLPPPQHSFFFFLTNTQCVLYPTPPPFSFQLTMSTSSLMLLPRTKRAFVVGAARATAAAARVCKEKSRYKREMCVEVWDIWS